MRKILTVLASTLLLAAGVIPSSAAETNSVPDGLSVTPAPGPQRIVNTICFCIKNAPEFSTFIASSLPNCSLTVTSPSGESKEVKLYIKPTEARTAGNFYADPDFTEAGVWTVTANFSKLQYMKENLSYMSLPEEWREFTYTYTVSNASTEPESPYSKVPEGAVWSEKGPGTYSGGFSGKAILDLSAVYSSITLSNPSAQATLLYDYGGEYESVTTTWLNDEHTLLQLTFNTSCPLYRQYGTYYIALPTAGTATLVGGGTEKLKNMKAGPWIREKTKTVPTVRSLSPSGAFDVSKNALPTTVTVKWQSYSGINIKFDKPLDNVTVTDPEGKVTQLPVGKWDDWSTQFTYSLPEGWYTGLGLYTFSFSYEGMSGDSESYNFIFPEDPYTWTMVAIEPGVSPESPVYEIAGASPSPNVSNNYSITEGTPATVKLTTNSEATIYYLWTPDGGTASENFEEYTGPLTFEEGGKLKFFAKLSGSTIQSDFTTLTFNYYRLIPNSDFTITPAPGKYTELEADNIVVVYTGDLLKTLKVLNNNDIMTITDPSGESKQYAPTVGGDNNNELTFDVSGVFEGEGTYTVDIDYSGYGFSATDGNGARIAPMSFTYVIDLETGVDSITESAGEKVYYDLTGRRVNGELISGIYIVKENGKVNKRLIK